MNKPTENPTKQTTGLETITNAYKNIKTKWNNTSLDAQGAILAWTIIGSFVAFAGYMAIQEPDIKTQIKSKVALYADSNHDGIISGQEANNFMSKFLKANKLTILGEFSPNTIIRGDISPDKFYQNGQQISRRTLYNIIESYNPE